MVELSGFFLLVIHCGNQPPRWPTVILSPRFMLVCSPLPTLYLDWSVWAVNTAEVVVCHFQGSVTKGISRLGFCIYLAPLESLALGEPAAISWGHADNLLERPTWQGNEASSSLKMCVWLFRSRSSNPSQAYRWLQPHGKPWLAYFIHLLNTYGGPTKCQELGI